LVFSAIVVLLMLMHNEGEQLQPTMVTANIIHETQEVLKNK
jgi:hypothetical protein